jgi:2,4-dienoyl-CoA reductase-like NADH-dependent reductase (Old Yellow Enzyme family)
MPNTNDPLLQPFQLKHLTLKNRVMSTSHACGLHDAGMPGERYQAYHGEKAKGGIALTMFGGSSNVSPDSPSVFEQLYVGDDKIIPYLQQFSERVHGHGAALMCQITHLGRRGDAHSDNWLPTIAPSPLRERLHRSFPREMDTHDITRVVKAYGAAARRCKEGGLDGIETLAGAHLIGQFLSPETNHRTDSFGGSLENRCRFGLMVFEEIRRQVGDLFLVGFRYVVDEGPGTGHEAGGLNFEDCVEIAHIFEAAGHIDFFNALYGRMDTERGLAVENMPTMAAPLAPWLDAVGAFKREVHLPVFHAARISDIATARRAIRDGLLDMVAMTRAHIADPHIVAKLAAGREDDIRPCVGATQCQSQFRPHCLHNAATGREAALPHDIPRAAVPGRKIVVVGGGPAGLEAARVSAERGHDVVLFEAASQLGGQVLLGACGQWRKDLIGIVDWRVAELARLGVEIRTNTLAAPADVVAQNPDAVVVATGGTPDLDWIDGAALCDSVWDVLSGQAGPQAGTHTIIYDGTGRHPALLAAEHLAMAGAQPEIVALDGQLAMETTYADRVVWRKRLYEMGVGATFDQRLVSVTQRDNRLAATFINELTGTVNERICDQIVVEHGTTPARDVFDGLTAQSTNDGETDLNALLAGRPQPRRHASSGAFELHRIGDAAASRNIHSAVLDALRLCAAF